MKDCVQSCHLTKFDVFGVKRPSYRAWNTVQNLFLIFFSDFCDTLNFISTSFKWWPNDKILQLPQNWLHILRIYLVFGDAVLWLQTFVWILIMFHGGGTTWHTAFSPKDNHALLSMNKHFHKKLDTKYGSLDKTKYKLFQFLVLVPLVLNGSYSILLNTSGKKMCMS